MSENDLQALIELARKHEMTPAERDAQIHSFAFGNLHLDNESITKADVDRAVDSLNGLSSNRYISTDLCS